MDAAKTRFTTKYPFFLAAALIAAAIPAQAQLQVSSSAVAPSNGQASQVNVTTSTGTSVTYQVGLNFGSGPQAGWFKVQDAKFNQLSNTSTESTGTPSAPGSGATLYISITIATGQASYSGTITLTDTSNASDTQTITVTYNPGGGTAGTVSVSPSSVSLISTPGNSTPVDSQVITISTSSSTQISGTVSLVNSSTSYLSLAQSTNVVGSGSLSFTVSSSSYFYFYVVGAPYTPQGSYSASVQVAVTNGASPTSSVGVSYSSGTGVLSASPSSFTLYYPGTPNSQQVSVVTPAAYYNATSETSWLLVNGANEVYNFNSGSYFTVSVNSAYAATVASGTVGSIFIQDTNGNTTTVYVTLNSTGSSSNGVTATPSTVQINVPAGTTSTQGSTVNLTTPYSGINYSVGWYTSSGNGSWLYASPTSGTLASGNQSNSVTIYASPSGLGTGTYTGTVTISYSGGFTSTQIPVTLVVGSNGVTGVGGLVAPASLSFAYQVGNVGPSNLGLSSSLLVNTTGSWTAAVTNISTTQQWLSVTPSGTGNQTVAVQVTPTGLQPTTYNADITVTTSNGTATIPVTLLVSSSMVAAANPAAVLVPNFAVGSTNPYPTSVSVYTSDNSVQTVTVTPSASWITTTCPSTTTVATCLVQINPAGLPNGLNAGYVTFTVTGAANTSVVLPVAIVVSGSTSSGGPLSFSASSLAFNTSVGGTPASQTLTVTSSTASQFTVSANSSGWLSVSPANSLLNVPQNITVSVNTSGLTANTYTGSLNFLSNGISQSLSVILNVGSASSSLTVSPGSLSFSYTASGTAPSAQSLSVQSSSGSQIAFTATPSTTSGGSWLTVNGSTGASSWVTSVTLTVGVNTAGLAAGTYSGTISLSSSSTGSVSVPVTLTVTASAIVSATPVTLTFNYTAGGSTPSTQAVTVNGSGTFSATAASNGNWLAVTPGSGTAPAALTVSVNPAGLSAGTYNGTIAVSGTGTASGSTTVNVSLVVTAPLPTITAVANGASYSTGAISPGEVITIFGTALGPTAPVQLTLTSTGTVSTTLGNVQVLVNGVACPLIYVSSTQISAVVPYEVAIFQTAQVYVNFLGQTSNAMQETVATTAPGIFTANSSGSGPGAILNQNYSVNSPSNPAAKGSVVAIYLTGEGQTSPKGVTGSVTQAMASPPYTPAPLLPVGVTINGAPASVLFAGEAPGIVAGVLQINVQIPANAASGNLPLVVSIGPNSTQTGATVVTVSVQ